MSAKKGGGPALAVPVTVEFEDVDSYGIAHHARLIAYLERARVRFLAERGVDLGRGDLHLVLYDLEARFLKTARLLDRLEVEVRAREVGAVKLVLEYRIRRGRELVARAATALAFVDGASKAPLPVPEELRRALAGGEG